MVTPSPHTCGMPRLTRGLRSPVALRRERGGARGGATRTPPPAGRGRCSRRRRAAERRSQGLRFPAHRDDAAPDPALPRQADVVEPLARGLVEAGRGQHFRVQPQLPPCNARKPRLKSRPPRLQVVAGYEPCGGHGAGVHHGLVRPSSDRSMASNELKGSPVLFTPSLRRASAGPRSSLTSANTNGLATLMRGKVCALSPAA